MTMDKTFPNTATDRIIELESEVVELQSRLEECYEREQAKYRRLINATSEGYVELDLNFNIIDANATIEMLTGSSRHELLKMHLDDISEKKDLFVHFASSNHLSYEAKLKRADGTLCPVLFKRSVIRSREGKPTGYLVFLTELTELKKAQLEVEKAKQRYKNIYKNASQGMYQCDMQGTLLSVNPAFATIFGFSSPRKLLSATRHITSFYKNLSDRQLFLSLLQKKQVVTDHEIEMIDRKGKSVWVLINANLAHDTSGNVHIDGILINNTKRRLAEEQLVKSRERFRYLANHDNLTTLFNTRYLYKSLEKLIIDHNESDKTFSLVFLDMDNFKNVVDTYGHLNGSQALKEVAETIKSCLVEPAYGVAYGGDEFVLVLPDTDKNEALNCVEKIRQKMKETIYLRKRELSVHLSASFGVASYPDDAKDSAGLLALADDAMFHIKLHGKDAVGVSGAADESVR